jgi:hypothetical protein
MVIASPTPMISTLYRTAQALGNKGLNGVMTPSYRTSLGNNSAAVSRDALRRNVASMRSNPATPRRLSARSSSGNHE